MTDNLGHDGQLDDQLDLELRGAAVELDHHLSDLTPGPFRPSARRAPMVVGVTLALLVGGATFLAVRDGGAGQTENVEAITGVDQTGTDEAEVTDPIEAIGEIAPGPAGTDPQLRPPLELVGTDRWFDDPTFGTPIRRLTDMPAGDSAAPLAVAVSAWNADETRLLLYQSGETPSSHRLLELTADGAVTSNTELDINPADIEQVFWSRSDPDVFYYPTGNTLVAFNVVTRAEEVLHRFESCDAVDTGRAPVAPSADERFWGLLCYSAGGVDGLVFDVEAGTERRVAVAAEAELAPIANGDGSRFVLESETGVTLLDEDLERIGELPGFEDGNLVIVEGRDGSEWVVGVVFDSEQPGTAVRLDLAEPMAGPTVIVGEETGYPYPPGGGTLLAGSGPRRPGLVLVAVTGDAVDGDSTVLDGEILIVDTAADVTVVRRVAHHRTSGDSYTSKPHISLSPSGRYAVFASDWGGGGQSGDGSGRAATNTFLLDLRGLAAE